MKRRAPIDAYYWLGAFMVAVWAVAILGADVWTRVGPDVQDLSAALQPPGSGHPFGTDDLGRDLFSRVVYGGRISVLSGLAIVVGSGIIGAILGGLSGYLGGHFDEVLMRITDIALSFPPVILAMAIAGGLGPSIPHAIFAMLITWWPSYARMMRGEVLRVKSLDYVTAARAIGQPEWRIFLKTIVPNTIGVLVIVAPMDIGSAITSLAGLSFLGLGAVPPTAEWGAMLNESRSFFQYWWMYMIPGLAMVSAVVGLNLVGAGLRRKYDIVQRKAA